MTDIQLDNRPLRATLYEIALQAENAAQLAQYYHDALGYVFTGEGDDLLGLARDRRLRIRAGRPNTLGYACYAMPERSDFTALQRRLTKAGVGFELQPCVGMAEALRFADPDGNSFVFGLAAENPVGPLAETADRAARLQHVVFASTDVSRLLAFFTEVVGFTLSDRVLDDHGGLRTAFMRCSEEHHSLAIFAASENRLDHHCYEAADWNLIRDWADHFARHRIPLKWGPGRHGPGDNLFLFIHDPEGNWVEISAELETVAVDRPVGDWPHEERTLNSWGMGLLRS
jgi:catechol 2,3-dioxygenase